ncbi:MAG: AprI/Inh family metalloprotease inhibitor [Bosea sp. (in: a-proteobacteria)]|nr:AprI/Inh family metalloprotease inhibitor [Bosea sp. (in: a-proteobacteria)]MDP3255808.1 AprI/Inh family metalloprotease inhibitor [Bosea sp. (in: a-proteobacteria)]MDP3320550.1 AprI/Inh family metalloprotease inhibitor [Bosea sp. (in: a-proteobacteria)]
MAMTLKAAGLLPLLALTACAGSQRFVGPAPQAYGQPSLPPAPAISSAPVVSEPLPPPGGYPVASAPMPDQPGALPPPQDPYYNPSAPGMPQQTPAPAGSQPGEVPTLRGGGGQIATLGAGSNAARPAVTSRDGVIGNWTAREATGGSCRVQLSSAPALDLYRANASGCSNRDLQRVTAWDYRDGEVYLYQQGGTVVARLRTSGGGAMDGAVTKSGAALSLSR